MVTSLSRLQVPYETRRIPLPQLDTDRATSIRSIVLRYIDAANNRLILCSKEENFTSEVFLLASFQEQYAKHLDPVPVLDLSLLTSLLLFSYL
jgi:hypothetical protein